ncbi:BTAD domain-containing putative transcriptional regulator [Kitasatospora sp. NPDC056138]|uniref:AfsR/SARP family transcriptional regulator n=1 Tax=Kitasatospora sp. NPDC056138 TaxID=3345724 RepID=UPI0035E34FBD
MRFGLLGSLTIHDDSGTAQTLRSPKGRALLAALLLEPNRPVSRDRLVGALWGEKPPATAAIALNNQVAQLRRFLGPNDGDRLRTIPPGYLLRVDESELDTEDFTRQLIAADTSRGQSDWHSVSEHSAAALALWRGSPLGDLPVLAEQETPYIHSLQEARLQAAEWHFEAALHLGRHQSAISEITRWVATHPLQEAFHVQLITALYRSGRQADALTAFEDIRTRLAEELGVDPGVALRAVHQQVLLADPELLWRPEPLRHDTDNSIEETAETAIGTEDSGSATQVRTAPALQIPAQLPADTRHFTGRSSDLRVIVDHLTAASASGEPCVLIVSGMGGVGKTALAIHAAHQVRHLFPDGQLYVDLRGFGTGEPREAHDVLAGFLTDLSRVDEHATWNRRHPEHTDDRAALLRTVLAERRVLLMLDNARDAAQILPLLPGNSRSAVVVSSRNTLTSLPSAVQVHLDPLDVEEQRALLSALCGTARVHQDPDGALRLLAACAGLPLALRIAGARLAARPAWSLSTLAQRLDSGGRRLRGLSTGHLGVRATFASSYLAMRDSSRPEDRDAARAFCLLGLWPAYPLSLQAAAALLGEAVEDTADVLDVLVDAHLLQNPSIGSYRFHDLLGEFAAQQAVREVTEDERSRALLRLLTWYYAAAHRADVQMDPSDNHTPLSVSDDIRALLPDLAGKNQALAWYTSELPALRESIRRARDCTRPDLAWRTAKALFGYNQASWWTGDPLGDLAHALETARRHQDLEGQAQAHNQLGCLHGMASRHAECLEHLQAAAHLFDQLGDSERLAGILTNLARHYEETGQLNLALAALERATQESATIRDDPKFLFKTASVLLASGDATAAENAYRKCLTACREHEVRLGVVATLIKLGDTLLALNRPNEALVGLQEALVISSELNDQAQLADTLAATARAHLHLGELIPARHHWEQALAIAHEHGIQRVIHDSSKGLEALRTVT